MSCYRTSKNCYQVIKIHKEIKNYYSTTKEAKVYTKPKVADCTLQLDIIERHVLLTNVHKVIKLKS